MRNEIIYFMVIFFFDKKNQQKNKPLIQILTEIIHLKTVKYVSLRKENRSYIYILAMEMKFYFKSSFL